MTDKELNDEVMDEVGGGRSISPKINIVMCTKCGSTVNTKTTPYTCPKCGELKTAFKKAGNSFFKSRYSKHLSQMLSDNT